MLQKLNPLIVVKKLKEKHLNIFTPLEFRRVFNISKHATAWLIKNYSKKDIFIKLRNGWYILADWPANHYLIANFIYRPSYISFETALSYYNIIPETIYPIISATPKTSREFTVENIEYVYKKIKKNIYCGYQSIQYLGETILIAEPEKALADYLYFIDLNKQAMNYERLDLRNINQEKFFRYIKLFKRQSLIDLSKKIYDQYRPTSRIK